MHVVWRVDGFGGGGDLTQDVVEGVADCIGQGGFGGLATAEEVVAVQIKFLRAFAGVVGVTGMVKMEW